MIEVDQLRSFICEKFADNVGLPQEELFGQDLALSEILIRAEKMTNSVDLMEAFARTANALRKEHGLRVRLPTLPLETPISRVLEVFLAEAQAQQTAAQQAPVEG